MNNMYLIFCLVKKKYYCVEICRLVIGVLILKECERKYFLDYYYCVVWFIVYFEKSVL